MEISQTTAAALDLLSVIADHPPLTVERLAEHAGTSVDICSRRLHTLAERGYAVLRSDGTWSLGPKLRDLASQVPDPLALAARDRINELAQRFAAAVVIATPAPPNFIIRIEREGRAGPVRVEHLSGVKFHIWQAPPGLALLPALDDAAISEIRSMAPDPGVVSAALDQLRRTGIVVAPSEVMTGRTGVATPITLTSGRTIASLTLAFPGLTIDDPEDTRAQLLTAARQISRRYEQLIEPAADHRSARPRASRSTGTIGVQV
ncbi:MarR family transcriptional regulator [Leucobacter soli]|uniref:IclR-ED domain-containing protein n=1 Tax=Leucobacter soli TaxID=2812850 RepID=A0A916JY20_9MICO|nr:MarR family transcriptional regulator [Leucobacter soli]CAG7610162.1 hypothetical protein LEUCIP111803_01269 [Leucobacter soli]